MLKRILPLLALSLALSHGAHAAPSVQLAIIKTARVAVAEGLLVPGGSFTKQIDSNFSAFLVRHGEELLLFDTGMGSQIDAQYRQDMPAWWRPFFKYEAPVRPARQQLDEAGLAPPGLLLLSHSHWDHAGGVPDFPAARIGVAAAELPLIQRPSRGPGGSWASQLAAPGIRWEALQFQARPHRGYAQSLDLFGDGTVVLVPMPGHTPGSMGLFVKVDSGREFFFIGDVAWTLAALRAGTPKFWAASLLVDGHAQQTLDSLAQVRTLMAAEPALVVVPAHDSAVQDALGYFPQWLR